MCTIQYHSLFQDFIIPVFYFIYYYIPAGVSYLYERDRRLFYAQCRKKHKQKIEENRSCMVDNSLVFLF